MRPPAASEIRGTWGTLWFPLEADGSIEWSRPADEIDLLIASGVDGIYSNGAACEFYAQTEEEFDRLHELLAGKCERAETPWQAGASHMSAQVALARVRRARGGRPSAIQIILPGWFPVSDREAVRFLSGIAEEAAPVRLVLYNPPHARRSLAPADFGKLARAVPALAGVKVPHSAAEWCADFRSEAPGLSLFVPGHQLATGIAAGAHGAYSDVACLNPSGGGPMEPVDVRRSSPRSGTGKPHPTVPGRPHPALPPGPRHLQSGPGQAARGRRRMGFDRHAPAVAVFLDSRRGRDAAASAGAQPSAGTV